MFQAYKDPDATLDYSLDWAAQLESDTIQSASWFAEDGITVTQQTFSATVSTVWLSGGELGKSYKITNRITTAGGRTDDRTLYIFVKEG